MTKNMLQQLYDWQLATPLKSPCGGRMLCQEFDKTLKVKVLQLRMYVNVHYDLAIPNRKLQTHGRVSIQVVCLKFDSQAVIPQFKGICKQIFQRRINNILQYISHCWNHLGLHKPYFARTDNHVKLKHICACRKFYQKQSFKMIQHQSAEQEAFKKVICSLAKKCFFTKPYKTNNEHHELFDEEPQET